MPALKTPIFFLKDVLCIAGILTISKSRLPKDMLHFRAIWITLLMLFIPMLISTALRDVILAFFAVKQYLLYIGIAILVIVAFPPYSEESFRKFLFACALLLIPTSMVAILQDALPSSHWLNLSVGGENLSGFSAAGHLRVASTFSFTAQYSWFLIAESFFLATSYFLQPYFKKKFLFKLMPYVYLGLVILLAVSAFITGGRTAVLGVGSTLALGTVFIGVKKPEWLLTKGVPILVVGIVCILFLKSIKPEYFVAYQERSAGTADYTHNEEITGRLIGGFTSWTDWFWEQDLLSVLLGNGLGIMSNGSAQVSKYAAEIRASGFWMEGDVPTTFWEGGIYLAILWYGFRLWVILLCYRLWRSLKNFKFASAASVPFAFVIIQGITGTLSMQPPLSIWWWLSIGVVFFIYRFEKYNLAIVTSIPAYKHE